MARVEIKKIEEITDDVAKVEKEVYIIPNHIKCNCCGSVMYLDDSKTTYYCRKFFKCGNELKVSDYIKEQFELANLEKNGNIEKRL